MIEVPLLLLVSSLHVDSQLELPVIKKQCVDYKKRHDLDSFNLSSRKMRLYELMRHDSYKEPDKEQNHEHE